MPNKALSRIHRQVAWDRLIAVVEEQAQTLIRTGFSVSTRESGDVSAGVFDLQGRMIAQAVTGTPGHVNTMARAVVHFFDEFPPQTMREGDVYITNDPWKGTGHLFDFTVVTPAFLRGKMVALLASTTHVFDVGGRGMGTDARHIFEEGLCIPHMHFTKAGTVNETLLRILQNNVREPQQAVGDIFSLAACNEVGGRRLAAMMDELAFERLDDITEHIIDQSRAATLEEIRKLPRGTFSNAMRIDGYDKPIDLAATMRIDQDGIAVDFTGTSGLSGYGINVPMCYTEAYSSYGIKCIVAPRIPNNHGSLSVMTFSASEGCILNARRPAPVASRHIVGQMLPDLMFGCLHKALPESVPAEGTSCLWNLYLMGGYGRVDADPESLRHAVAFNMQSFHAGGAGARPGKDGLSATSFPSGVRNVPVEITEAMSPVIVRCKEYRTDSGGPGRFRGGLGQRVVVESLDHAPFAISAKYDRIDFPARGRNGGANGARGVVRTGSGRTLKGKGQQTLAAGESLVLEMPGGGGLGDPREREARRVLEDVAAGLVSREAALRDYAVAIDDAGELDADGSERLRGAKATG